MIPMERRQRAVVAEAVSPARCAGRVKSILVVDDDEELRAVIAQLLEARGWSVTTASDGHEALGLVRVAVPDVVLADMEMPGMGGPELRRALYLLPEPPRVILMSGRRGPEQTSGSLQRGCGAELFLRKPLGEAELLHALDATTKRQEG